MGMTYVTGAVRRPGTRGKPQRVRFLVDTGAIYTVLPERTWRRLGLAPERTVDFTLADGTTISRGVSECRLELGDRGATSPVILGVADDGPLLGTITLETLGLMVALAKATPDASHAGAPGSPARCDGRRLVHPADEARRRVEPEEHQHAGRERLDADAAERPPPFASASAGVQDRQADHLTVLVADDHVVVRELAVGGARGFLELDVQDVGLRVVG
jgi:predicted aspartyl protease